jgi:hypothetical protein
MQDVTVGGTGAKQVGGARARRDGVARKAARISSIALLVVVRFAQSHYHCARIADAHLCISELVRRAVPSRGGVWKFYVLIHPRRHPADDFATVTTDLVNTARTYMTTFDYAIAVVFAF